MRRSRRIFQTGKRKKDEAQDPSTPLAEPGSVARILRVGETDRTRRADLTSASHPRNDMVGEAGCGRMDVVREEGWKILRLRLRLRSDNMK